jgi:hypothetical protein
MSKPEVVIAMYRPHEGKTQELDRLVSKHSRFLKESGLTTARESLVAQSADGSILEIFEWASHEASQAAHKHPEIVNIWKEFATVCDFGKLDQLPEAKNRFPHFQSASFSTSSSNDL